MKVFKFPLSKLFWPQICDRCVDVQVWDSFCFRWFCRYLFGVICSTSFKIWLKPVISKAEDPQLEKIIEIYEENAQRDAELRSMNIRPRPRQFSDKVMSTLSKNLKFLLQFWLGSQSKAIELSLFGIQGRLRRRQKSWWKGNVRRLCSKDGEYAVDFDDGQAYCPLVFSHKTWRGPFLWNFSELR